MPGLIPKAGVNRARGLTVEPTGGRFRLYCRTDRRSVFTSKQSPTSGPAYNQTITSLRYDTGLAAGSKSHNDSDTSLTVDQIVAETSEWPADAVADLADRIALAKPGGLNAERGAAGAETALRRSAALDSGQETLVPGHEVSARIRRIF